MFQKKKIVLLARFLTILVVVLLLLGVSVEVLAEGQPGPQTITEIFRLYLPMLFDPNPATTTPTPIPPGFISNPGFEEGVTGWTFTWNTANPIVTDNLFHSGQNSSSLGDDDLTNGNGRKASVTQSLTVPVDQPFLTFWSYFVSQDVCGTDPDDLVGDYLVVTINNDRIIFWPVCEPENGPWVKRTVDLNAYKGNLTWVKVEYTSDLTIPSAAYVDDFGWSAVP